jgi:alkylation response protein AidB-like acyl-CoA dehydrogenase
MNFGFTEEQELLRKTARAFLEEFAPTALARRVLERREIHSAALWSRFAELGWTGLCVPESQGGAGLSPIELCILIEELGRNLAPVPFVPHALATSAVLEVATDSQRGALLRGLASGETIGTVCLSAAGHSAAKGGAPIAEMRAGGFSLRGSLHFVPDAASAQLLIAPAVLGGEVRLFAVPQPSRGIAIRPMQALDLLRPLYEVVFEDADLPADALLGVAPAAPAGLERFLDRALLSISAEMLGGAEQCLETAVRYARERVQFGKPIGVHQAIKHKCADMLFAVEAARSITYYAAFAAREQLDDAGVLASMAKATAGDAYRRAAADNLQIHGGVGFSWETDCHLYLRRARSDDAWFGGASFHRERIAHRLGFATGSQRARHSG